MYDYKSDNKQLLTESKIEMFKGLGNVFSDFKLRKGNLPQWAVDWAKSEFNMDAGSVKFYVMDKPKVNDSTALAGGNRIFVSSDHKNDKEVIKHELTHIYQQAVGSAQKGNENDPELEREAVGVSNGKSLYISKNSKFDQSFVIPKENTGVVQGFGGNEAKIDNKDEVVIVRPSQGTVLTSNDTSPYNGCENIKIDESVTRIDDGAFSGFENLITIDIPNVTEIGQGAFWGCTNLKEISIPNVGEIYSSTFEYCRGLIKIDISNAELIGESTFNECKNLKEINMTSVTEICNDAFGGCESLITIDMPNVTRIGSNTFDGCTSLRKISMPKIEKIGKDSFGGCMSLSSVNMQDIKEIGESNFKGLANLSSVNMPNVGVIGKGAFMNCPKLSSVEMPNVTKIDEAAFWGCISLSSAYMPNVKEIGIAAFISCQSLSSVDIPNVTEIYLKTFLKCTSLSRVNIPNVMKVGESAFEDCTSLKKVTLPYYCKYSGTSFNDECEIEYGDMPDIANIDKSKLMELYKIGRIKPGDLLKNIDISTIGSIDDNNWYLLVDALYSERIKLAEAISRFKINPEDLLISEKYGFDIYDAYMKNWISEDEINILIPNINLFSRMNTKSDAKYYSDNKIGLGEGFRAHLPNFERLSIMPKNVISEFSSNYRGKSSLWDGMRSGIYQYSNGTIMNSRTLINLIPYIRNTGNSDIKLYRGIKGYEAIDYMANMPMGSFAKNNQCILGKEIFDRSFTSMTINKRIAREYASVTVNSNTAVLLKVIVPKGVKLNMMPIANANDEVVFNRFQKLKVTQVTKENNMTIITCEAIQDKDSIYKTEKDIYESSEFKKYQEEFEIDLGRYLYRSNEAYQAVQMGINKLKEKNPEKGPREIFFSNNKYTKENFSGNVTEFGGQDLTNEELEAVLREEKPTDEDLQSSSTTVAGNLREKLGAFQFAVDNGELDGDNVSSQRFGAFEPYIGRRNKANEDQEKLKRDFDYQDRELQLFRSARERRYQEKFRKDGKSPITYGQMLFQPKYKTKNIDSFYGKRLVAGTSGTAMRLLSKYSEQVSEDEKDLLNFRLVLMACMLPEKNHSLYEILQGSHGVGVVGYENLSTADTMDKTIDPLGEDKVRKNVCKDQKFPYERALENYSKKNVC